jgi:ketosteroid isomerase-like protein
VKLGTENKEAVRGFADAISANDLDAALPVCHPEIELESVLAVTGRAYLGHDGIREYFDDIASAWDEWSVEVHRVENLPDGRVQIEMTMHARGRKSGVTLTEPTTHIWTLRDGKLIKNELIRAADQHPPAAP